MAQGPGEGGWGRVRKREDGAGSGKVRMGIQVEIRERMSKEDRSDQRKSAKKNKSLHQEKGNGGWRAIEMMDARKNTIRRGWKMR